MEFTIDFPTVRKISAAEYTQAKAAIAQSGPLHAYRQSLTRHDQALATAADANTLACKAGCSWCCYFSVDARAVEIFNILEFVAREFSPQQQARVRSEIETNSARFKNLSDMERMQLTLKCPFLDGGRCSIYAARPQTCRNYHATDAAGCQKSYEEPNNLEIDPEFAPEVFQNGGAQVDAFAAALRDAGYDIATYELSTALSAALLQGENAQQRFESKQQPFIELSGEELPLEFMDTMD